MEQTSKLLHQWLQESLLNRIIVNTKDESVLVFIPEGKFTMGDSQDDDNPKHEVFLSGYWIGMYCITNAQYAKFIQATGYYPLQHKALCNPSIDKTGKTVGNPLHPITCIGWEDAKAYAKWANCQLPTEAQWEKAARGPQGLLYPWGNSWNYRHCQCNRHNRNNNKTCMVYDYPTGVSGYGTYNQSGNVWEWCADWYDSEYYRSSNSKQVVENPQGPDAGSYRVIRGGSSLYNEPGYFRTTYRYWHDPGYRRNSVGL